MGIIQLLRKRQGGINDPHIFKAVFTAGGPGSGKCLGSDVPVMLHTGRSIPAADIKVGDVLMGDDSTPRNVVRVSHEQGPMVRVTPVKGDSFECGKSHIMVMDVLRRTKKGGVERSLGYEAIEMDIQQYMDMSARFKAKAKLVRTGVEFPSQEVPVDPYFLGLWLGDGHKHAVTVTTEDDEIFEALFEEAEAWGLTLKPWSEAQGGQGNATAFALSVERTGGQENPLLTALRELGVAQPTGFEKGTSNKHVPWSYKRNSKAVRLQVIAGLIDSDGHYSTGCVEFTQKIKQLAEDFVWLCRSVGLAAYMTPKPVKGEVYWRVSLSGDLSVVPTRVPRKQAEPRRQIKNVLHTGFTVEPIEDGTYCSIETDGNHRHLLGDFTVTHNSFIAKQMFEGTGLKFLNSDTAFEYLLKQRNLSLDITEDDPEEYAKQMKARKRAKQLTNLQKAHWLNGMLGLVIDGTGKDYQKIKGVREGLEAIGYDTAMIYVNTSLEVALQRNRERPRSVDEKTVVIPSWKKVQSNMGKFQGLFSPTNFFLVDNSKALDDKGVQELGTRLRKKALNWLKRPLRNPVGNQTVDMLRKTGGKTIKDLSSYIEKAAMVYATFVDWHLTRMEKALAIAEKLV